MSIIKKIGKFIASRALYFILGILIAVGATYAYATWDEARTLGNTDDIDELTRDNWNELVDMIESEIRGGGIDWSDCESKYACYNGDNEGTITCTTGYTLVTHSCSMYTHNIGSGTNSNNHSACYLSDINSVFARGNYDYNDYYAKVCASIKCCKYVE